LTTTTGLVKVSAVDSSFNGNQHGIHAKGNARVTAEHCMFARNTSDGVRAEGIGGVGVVNLSNSVSANNGANGVQALTGGSVVRISNCDLIQNNGNGALVGAGGEVDTLGNNRVFGNGTNGCPSCTGVGPA
ncbi:MAG TPA: right-handed parallel beta-helix repeat-containing protein, partial [Pyrinomonadaceae bacterium]|nr:right-handed parallel beta-helix repeat-containing protein [Pyrinomonadaceae bacterium]